MVMALNFQHLFLVNMLFGWTENIFIKKTFLLLCTKCPTQLIQSLSINFYIYFSTLNKQKIIKKQYKNES